MNIIEVKPTDRLIMEVIVEYFEFNFWFEKAEKFLGFLGQMRVVKTTAISQTDGIFYAQIKGLVKILRKKILRQRRLSIQKLLVLPGEPVLWIILNGLLEFIRFIKRNERELKNIIEAKRIMLLFWV